MVKKGKVTVIKKIEENKPMKDNSFGIMGVILGILSILFSGANGFILGILGIIFSVKQKRTFKNKWSLWGMILSIIGVILGVIGIIFFFYAIQSNPDLMAQINGN